MVKPGQLLRAPFLATGEYTIDDYVFKHIAPEDLFR